MLPGDYDVSARSNSANAPKIIAKEIIDIFGAPASRFRRGQEKLTKIPFSYPGPLDVQVSE